MEQRVRPVLLYDAGCRLCRFAARTITRLDRDSELLYLPLHDAEAAPLLRDVPDDERDASWRLVTGGASVGYGSGAVEVARSLRLTRPVARVLGAIPAGVLDRVYGEVSRHRARLGRLVPDGPAPRRYP
jgi:predicted DCC family thiol-disulfide oxidoreductase YuxK